MTNPLVVGIIYEEGTDELGDLPFTLSNNDRCIIRKCLLAVIQNAALSTEQLSDLVEFNHNFEDQFDAHRGKTHAKN